jgi:hypothetical protein
MSDEESVPRSVITEWDWDDDFSDECQVALSKCLDLLDEILYMENDYEGEELAPENPSGYPYDGCPVCVSRELLVTLVPVIASAAYEGRIWRTARNKEKILDLSTTDRQPGPDAGGNTELDL